MTKFSRNLILLSLAVLCVMFSVDYAAVSLALVSIAKDIHAPLHVLQWAISAYIMVIAAFAIPAGNFANVFGPRRMFLLGLTLFVLSSIAAGTSHTATMLIASRLVQGLGGALLLPPIYALIFQIFPAECHGYAIGVLSGAIGVGLSIGPPLAGLLIHTWTWRSIFFINIPLGVVVFLLVILILPKEPKPYSEKRMKLLDSFILAAGFIMVMVAVNSHYTHGVRAQAYVWTSGVLIAIFIIKQFIARNPLFPMRYFKSLSFSSCTVSYIILQVTVVPILLLFPLYLQNVKQFSADYSGLLLLAFTIIWGVLSPLGGKMIDKFGGKLPLVIGFIVAGLGLVLSMNLMVNSSVAHIVLALLVCGAGFGLLFPAVMTIIMKTVPEADVSLASGGFNALGILAGAIANLVVATTYVHHTFAKTTAILTALKIHLSGLQAVNLQQVIAGTHFNPSALGNFTLAQVKQLVPLIQDSFVYAQSRIFYIEALLAVVGLIVVALFVKKRVS